MKGNKQRRRFSKLVFGGPIYIRMLKNTVEPAMYAKG
jgi:hypothetical protein